MITVIIPTSDDEEDLAHALAALAPAAMDGIVRDVIVVDGGSGDGTLTVADEAGCGVVEGRGSAALMQAAEMARGDWLLFMSPATILEPGWQAEVLRFVERAVMAGTGRTSAASFRLRRPEAGLRPRIAESAAHFLSAPYGEQGLLLARDFYRSLGGHRDLPAMADVDIARRIGRRRLTLLRAHGMVRQPERRPGPARALRNAACVTLFVLRLPPRLIGRLAA